MTSSNRLYFYHVLIFIIFYVYIKIFWCLTQTWNQSFIQEMSSHEKLIILQGYKKNNKDDPHAYYDTS